MPSCIRIFHRMHSPFVTLIIIVIYCQEHLHRDRFLQCQRLHSRQTIKEMKLETHVKALMPSVIRPHTLYFTVESCDPF